MNTNGSSSNGADQITMVVDDNDDQCPLSPGSAYESNADLMAAAFGDEVTAQLAAAGPLGVAASAAAAAAIASSQKRQRKRPSIRKRQQNRLIRKFRQTIDEFRREDEKANAAATSNANCNSVGVLKMHTSGVPTHKIEIQANGSPQIIAASPEGLSGSSSTQVCLDPVGYSSDVDITTQYTLTVLHTITNPDGTVSIVLPVDPNNSIITLPDGTTAHVPGITTLQTGNGEGTPVHTIQIKSEGGGQGKVVDLNSVTEATLNSEGQIILTVEDGHGGATGVCK